MSISSQVLAQKEILIRLSGDTAENISKRVTVKQIEKIGITEVNAFNPYEKKADDYTGVWLHDFVKHYGISGVNKIKFSAIDDYNITFSDSEWKKMRILIATRVNGKYIGYDKKGPLRIIFPDYDAKKEVYQNILPKWMWMINKVKFIK